MAGKLGMDWLTGAGAQEQFAAFAAAASGRLAHTAYLLTGSFDETEDLVQEALIRVARRWPRVRIMDHPDAYARRVLVNLVVDGAAGRSRRTAELGREAVLERRVDDRAGRAVEAVETESVWAAALAELPLRQRAVIVLRYWDDLSEAEVAAILGCSVGTVKSAASRGLTRLREAMNESDPADRRSAP